MSNVIDINSKQSDRFTDEALARIAHRMRRLQETARIDRAIMKAECLLNERRRAHEDNVISILC